MDPVQQVAGNASLAMMLVLLLGLAWRGLWRVTYAFTAYLCAVAACSLLMRTWPVTFYTMEFYVQKECLYGLLKLALAVELALLAFVRLPGARLLARAALGLGGTLLALALAFRLSHAPDAFAVTERLLPLLANGTALLFAAVWGLALYFHVPLHPLHRALLRGFVPYLLVFALLLNLLRRLGWELRPVVGWADGFAYAAMLAYWAYTVWRLPLLPPADPDLVDELQPWRTGR